MAPKKTSLLNYLRSVGKKRKEAKKGQPQLSKKRRFFNFAWKSSVIGLVIFVCYGVYLDYEIRTRIDGKVWDLPVPIYGRMVNLEPGMVYSQKELVDLLRAMQYREVPIIARPGEFRILDGAIELMRRPFNFPDGKEGALHALMVFNNERLDRIVNADTQNDFGFFRLDPRLITMIHSTNGEQRLIVSREDFPELLVATLLATEDRHFYEHDGVSFLGIARALVTNIVAGRTVQGGSTLTQQLVKNLFLSNKRSLWRKVNEAYMALLLDARYDKDRILELYMNEVYFGQGNGRQIRGFPLASQYYFGRPVNELTLDQIALLVGMVKGASLYNPWRRPELTVERRNVVLKLLETQQIIDNELFDMMSQRPLTVQPKGGIIVPQPAFVDMVRQELTTLLGDKIEDMSGIKVFTTLDPVSQLAAEHAVETGVGSLKKSRELDDLEAAMVVVDRMSGEVRAAVGGANPQFAGFNRVTSARRQVGSLAKPAVYLTALQEPDNYRLNTIIADEPYSLHLSRNDTWSPRNDDRQFRGNVPLIDGLARSINIPTVKIGMGVGLDNVVDTIVRLGVPYNEIHKVPAMLLGSYTLTPLEVAQQYQSMASGGKMAKLSTVRSVIGSKNEVLYQSYPKSKQVVAEQAAYLTMYSMQQVTVRGTAKSLQNKFAQLNLATKTGTTSDQRDSWFAGVDGKDVSIVWVGRDSSANTKLYGSTGALTLYSRYLEKANPMPLTLTEPEDINFMTIDDDYNFTCKPSSSLYENKIPVWTADPRELCETLRDKSAEPEKKGGWLGGLFN